MRVSVDWLKELVEVKDINEVIRLLPLRTIGTKEVTDDSIELDMKGYNRADLLSMRGVALEVAAISDSKVKFRDEKAEEILKSSDSAHKQVKVIIENAELCPLYCVAKIENLKVEESDKAWVKKLYDCGLRSINNVADITNLVMLEYGQPLHAFDTKAVKDKTIVVRNANLGEKITTLDGKTRDLEPADLLIADPQTALGIAGVMGGKDSEVSGSTTTILLEAAIFDPASLRKTSTRLGLASEASKRFYHGLTKKRLFQALNAAIKMYENLGGQLTALTIVGDFEDQQKNIKLTKEKLDSLIGVEISEEEVEGFLKKLHFSVISTSTRNDKGKVWNVAPPYWRLDINIEEDLVEEIARMFGYEKIPAKEIRGKIPPKIDQSLFEIIDRLKTALVDAGLTEIQTYSFYSTRIINNLQFMDNLVKITNPISSETEYLRDNLWPNLLEKVTQNLKHGFSDVGIFEIGKVYKPVENDRPKESYRLSIALCNGRNNPMAELYSIAQKTLKPLEESFSTGNIPWNTETSLFHPKRWTFLTVTNQKNQGIMAEVHPRIVNRFMENKRVAVLEIDLNSTLQ